MVSYMQLRKKKIAEMSPVRQNGLVYFFFQRFLMTHSIGLIIIG